MIDIPHILRATARLLERARRAPRHEAPGPTPDRLVEPPCDGDRIELQDCLEPFDDLLDDDADWRRWYDEHRTAGHAVPAAVVHACLEDIREAGILHSVAILEIARKWGLDARA